MRTVLTTEDIKDIFKQIFVQNSEDILLIDEETGEKKKVELWRYFNIEFYAWKDRLVQEENGLSLFESFEQQLSRSLDKAFALVEITDASATPSQDVDSATINGKVTFLIQTNKVVNLDYYISKIRNKYLGLPEEYQNSNGEVVTAYFNIGTLLYESEPATMQTGEVIVCSVNFGIDYMTKAKTYSDYKVKLSLDGTHYYDFPYIKATWQQTVVSQMLPTQSNITRQGAQCTGIVPMVTFATYDFDSILMSILNEIFFSMSANKIDGVANTNDTVEYPIYMKVIVRENDDDETIFDYNMVITDMEKTLENGAFAVTSISLKAKCNI